MDERFAGAVYWSADMKYFYIDNNGNEGLASDWTEELTNYIEVSDEFNFATHYVKNGVEHVKPAKPDGNNWWFNAEIEDWVSLGYAVGIDDWKKASLLLVKESIATARLDRITSLPGQDAIYQAKENEAVAYLAATNPVLTDYPLLNAETGITAATPEELANLWLALAQQWRSVAAQLEAARMTANASIGSATTIAEIDAALATLDAAIANLP